MACSRGFFSGLRDFLAAPLRLWLMHKRLVQLNPSEKHLKTVQQHHLEHTRRMQLRERLHDSYSSSSTGRVSDTTTRVSASVDLVDSGGLIQPLVRIWLINVGLILSLALFSYLFSLVRANRLLDSWIFSSSSFHVVSQLISGLLHICLPLFMELVNMLYLKVSLSGFRPLVVVIWNVNPIFTVVKASDNFHVKVKYARPSCEAPQ
ncbi:hypothetical protein P879_10213 [Paragonimus westermani]|uniref:Uncharacterized protein n=1 Tax=Paragonimus westermani TaxID=34504 RepID=A0A8T0D6K6_9TREM|nr:hypothetical protein P879_10213 [Paragonimus westermani]